GMGAVASDVDTACRPLRAVADGDVGVSSAAWADAWSALAERLRRQARHDEAEHHRRSAGEKYLRGALYFLMAERALRCADPRKLEIYREATAMFARGVARRPDVDATRIGIMAPSLGGYYAPRAAAFEKRLACCVAWGAFYDAGKVLQLRMAQGDRYARSVPDVEDQMLWVTGTDSLEAAI